MNAAAISRDFFDALASADMLLRDGSGMAILLRLLNQPPGRNLNGTDLIPKILGRCGGRTIALFGTQDPYLARARRVVASRIAPGVRCIAAHGFLDTACYVRLAAAHRPAVIVLGMGMPRQEEVAVALRLFRLALEPRRLFRRYVIGNPLFIARAFSLAAQTLRNERGAAT